MNWTRINLADPKYAKPAEPPATCGLIYLGKRHAFSGLPESAKTLLTLILGLEHMRAGHGGFAFIDFENGEEAVRLLLVELGATLAEIAAIHYINATGAPAVEDTTALYDDGVTLAAIDALAGAYDISQLDDNKRADAEIFARCWINPLWKCGIATIGLDHLVKNADNRGKFAIGSERKLGTVDVHLGFEAIRTLSRGGSGLIRIRTHKDRPGHLKRDYCAEIHLHSDPETHRIIWEIKPASDNLDPDGTFRPTVLMDRVLEYVARNPAPISRSALADRVKGNRQYLLQAVEILVAEGRLREVERKLVPGRNVPELRNDSESLNHGNGNVPGTFRNESFLLPQGEERLSGTTFGNDFDPEPDPEPGPAE
jgi:hypothetical protein